jgi:hypothetical protein
MRPELLPLTVSKADGPAFWFVNGLYVLMATTESTGGAFAYFTKQQHRAM